MKCPVCASVDLLMTDRQGVEIDYCPQCRGIWLDRGELDKLIERSVATTVAPAPPQQQVQQPYPAAGMPQAQPVFYQKKHDDHHDKEDHHNGHGGMKKRKSFLSEMFDIG